MTEPLSTKELLAIAYTDTISEKGTTMDLNETIKTFVLNIPAIIDLRNDVANLKSAPGPSDDIILDRDDVRDLAREYIEEDFDLEYAISNVDLSDAIQNAITYGYVDLSGSLDYDEIVSNSSEFGDLQTQVDDVKENVNELTSALDDLSDANDSEERIARLESLVSELESRLDNARIDI